MPLEAPVLQVSQALTFCNTLLRELPLRVEGEVSNFSLARGQFVFFDLKDEQEDARLSCFMMAHQLAIPLENGMRILIQGTPGLYQKSGAFRITVSRVEPRGDGSRKRAFELLRAKLEAEGLFDPARKRLLPRFVRDVGIISSSEAAGFGDFIKVARERLPGIHFYLVNVAVQGERSEAEICQAFKYLNGHFHLDAIVLTRGGGSAEDLHAFNSEVVARAIAGSKAPVLVGIGHERDLTIADLASDVRASTPSNAAQLLLPSALEVRGEVAGLTRSGERLVKGKIERFRYEVTQLLHDLTSNSSSRVQEYRERVKQLAGTIEALSPQATLARGYSISQSGGKVVRSVSELEHGELLLTHFFDGTIESVIQ